MEVKGVQERDRQEIRDLLLSILSNLSNDETKDLIRVAASHDIRPVDEIMGSIQTVSINPLMWGNGRLIRLGIA